MLEVDAWDEDDYTLILYQDCDLDDVAEFSLVQRKNGQPDRDVTTDFDAYARRIKDLKEKMR